MLLNFFYLFGLLASNTAHATFNPTDWKTVEALAEEHPYVVPILNYEKEYICTGAVIDKRTVLSSGACITPEPHYVALAAAVLHPRANKTRLLKVAFSKLHDDYKFDFFENDYNISAMHSNIGLIFTVLPILEYFFEGAILSNYYATELMEKHLFMVGYGKIATSEGVVLQQQSFHQMACMNPKWYYCICGIEYWPTTYVGSFGEGGPVLYGNEIVGIAATPSGTLTFRPNINYNIFTVVGPYVAWIQKSKFNSIVQFISNTPKNRGIHNTLSGSMLCILMSLIKICL